MVEEDKIYVIYNCKKQVDSKYLPNRVVCNTTLGKAQALAELMTKRDKTEDGLWVIEGYENT